MRTRVRPWGKLPADEEPTGCWLAEAASHWDEPRYHRGCCTRHLRDPQPLFEYSSKRVRRSEMRKQRWKFRGFLQRMKLIIPPSFRKILVREPSIKSTSRICCSERFGVAKSRSRFWLARWVNSNSTITCTTILALFIKKCPQFRIK
jgi:hypothetical protein